MTIHFICTIRGHMIYGIILFVFVADQLTKLWAVTDLSLYQAKPVLPFFNLFLTLNRGVSFSLFSSDSRWMPLILSALTLGISGMICYWLAHEKNRVMRIGLALVLGGALGNLIDRIRMGAVIDFLDFYIGEYHWPAFNLADSAICIGVALILIQSFWKEKKK